MKRTMTIVAGATVALAAAGAYMVPHNLMTLLNGLFVGSFVSLAVVVRSLAWNSIVGRIKYRDVSVFTLGLLFVMAGALLWVMTSIYINASDFYSPTYTAIVIAKYLMICGFLSMAYSPDVGVGLLDGHDRQIIALSVVAGLLVAAATVYAQAYQVLS